MDIVINAFVHNLTEKGRFGLTPSERWEYSHDEYYYGTKPFRNLRALLEPLGPGVIVETSRPLGLKVEGDTAPEMDVSFFVWRDGPCGLPYARRLSDFWTNASLVTLLTEVQKRDAEYPPLRAIENWITGHPLAAEIEESSEMTPEEHAWNVFTTILNDSTKRQPFLELPYDGRSFNLGVLLSCAAPRVLPSAFAQEMRSIA